MITFKKLDLANWRQFESVHIDFEKQVTILTGQNRIIEGVVRMLSKTLPKFPTTEAAFTGQLRQTVKNSFRLSMSLSKSLTNLEDLQELQEADPEVIDTFMENLISATAFTSDDESLFNQVWGRIKATPAAKAEGLETPVGESEFDTQVNQLLDSLDLGI